MSSLKAERIARITFWTRITAWHKMSQLYNWPAAADRAIKFRVGFSRQFHTVPFTNGKWKELKSRRRFAERKLLQRAACLSALYWWHLPWEHDEHRQRVCGRRRGPVSGNVSRCLPQTYWESLAANNGAYRERGHGRKCRPCPLSRIVPP